MVPSCAEGGVLGVLCASVGATQVTEAIKLLAGIGEPLIGRLQIYDALEMSWRQLRVRKDPQCVVCGENPTVTELIDYDEFCGAITDEAAEAVAGHTVDVKQLAQWLADRESGTKDFVLIDVREQVERDINVIPGSILIPKGDFQTGVALGDLPQDKQVVLYCKTGVRSAEVLALVHGAGLADAVHVGGGVSAWVRQIDPSQPAY
jgi:adenylyltransferase/sulfurtransferase